MFSLCVEKRNVVRHGAWLLVLGLAFGWASWQANARAALQTLPTLGAYANATVTAGGSTSVAANAAPAGALSVTAVTAPNFAGTFAVNPVTGVVRINNAQPAGSYTVTVKAVNSTGATATQSFTLTVTGAVACVSTGFANAADVGVDAQPMAVTTGDFNGDGKLDWAAANVGSATVSIRLGDGLGGFTGSTNVSVGNNPISLATGDFNGDGKLDLATANNNSPGTVSVRLGDGMGGFGGTQEVAVGFKPQDVVTGDFNGDGQLDFAAMNNTNSTVSVRLGDGAGAFSNAADVAVGSFPTSLATGDFNNDGLLDFITTSYVTSGSVSLRLGNGAGGFTGATNLSMPNAPRSIAVGDFNGDAKLDFITGNYSNNTATVRLGDGAGGFGNAINFSSSSVSAVATGDFDGDGKLDCITANDFGSSGVVRFGDGAGNFPRSANVTLGAFPQGLATGDFNGDGKLDFVAANSLDNSVALRLNSCRNSALAITPGSAAALEQGSNTSQVRLAVVSAPVTAASALSVTVTSLPTGLLISNVTNTNGVITAQLSVTCNMPLGAATVSLRVTDGASSATANFVVNVITNTPPVLSYNAQRLSLGSAATVSPATGLMDGGSITSVSLQSVSPAPASGVISVNSSGVVTIPNNVPAGTYTVKIRATDNCGAVTEAPFGLTVFPPPSLGVYPNTYVTLGGSTNITPDAPPISALGVTAQSAANFTGLLMVNPLTGVVRVMNAAPLGTHTITIKATNPAGPTTRSFTLTVGNATACTNASFSGAADIVSNGYSQAIATGDFNNDGKPDLAIAEMAFAGHSVNILLGNGAGAFTSVANVGTDLGLAAIALGDFNNDGRLDFATANSSDNTVSVRLGNGAGGFSGTTDVNVGAGAQAIVVRDFNGDGNLDFATANSTGNTVSVRLGDGAGGFTGTTEIAVSNSPYALTSGDFTGDGRLDLAVVSYSNNTVALLTGSGTGGFTSLTTINVGSGPYAITAADFNRDGKLDFATASGTSNFVSVRLGNGGGGFTEANDVTVGNAPFDITTSDFNGDGWLDLATANYASDTVSLRLGNGAGGFTTATDVNVASGPVALATGDFNGDGKLDFAANTNGTSTSVRLNSCTKTSLTLTPTAAVTVTQGGAAASALVANISDGTVGANFYEVKATNVPPGLTVSDVVNVNSTVTATIKADCSAAAGAQNVTLTVTNNNGLTASANLVVNVTANTPPVLSYAAQGVALGSAATINPSNTPTDNGFIASFAVQSITPAPASGTLSVNAAGVVTVPNNLPAGTYTVLIRATDNCGVTTDAQLPLTVVPAPVLGTYANATLMTGASMVLTPSAGSSNTTSATAQTSAAFKGLLTVNPATGAVRVTNAQPAGTYPVTVKAFNAGAMTTQTFTLTVKPPLACANGGFANTADYGVGANPYAVAVGDFNNDNVLDFAAANSNDLVVSVYLGTGAGGFTSATPFSAASAQSLAIGDVNGDGNQDLLVANTSGVAVGLGKGDGSFNRVQNVSLGSLALNMALADFNGDGSLDIVTTHSNGSFTTGGVLINYGDGAGKSMGTASISVGGFPMSIATGDFNGDGRLDFATANWAGGGVSVRLRDSAGNYANAPDVESSVFPRTVATGDFNGDGKTDLVFSNPAGNQVLVRWGDGTGKFIGATNVGAGTNPYDVLPGDFNGDGKLDFIASNFNGANISLRLGTAVAGFSNAGETGAGSSPRGLAAGDFNGDGRLDFVTVNQNSNTASVRLNNCTNTAPTIAASAPLTLMQNAPASNVTLATVSDAEAAANTLSVTATLVPFGITVSNLANNNGVISADVAAACAATPGAQQIELTVTDGEKTAKTLVTVNVTAAAVPVLSFNTPAQVPYGTTTQITPATAQNGTQFQLVSQGGYAGAVMLTTGTNAGGLYPILTLTNPTASGNYVFRVSAANVCGATVEASFTVAIACPSAAALSWNALPAAINGTPYSAQVAASGLAGTLSYSLSTGSILPLGLSLVANGTLSGTVLVPGNYSFNVSVTNGACSLTKAYTLTVGATPPVAGRLRALSLPGYSAAQNYVTVTPSPAVQTYGALTVEAWVKPGSATGRYDIVNRAPLFFNLQDGKPALWLSGITSNATGGYLYADTTIPVGVWTHIAATWSGAQTKQIQFYINGVSHGSYTMPGSLFNETWPLTLGYCNVCGTANTGWLGELDEVRLWNVARAATEIAANQCLGLTGTESGLEAYWRFDETKGTTVTDATGRGFNGTLNPLAQLGSNSDVFTTNEDTAYSGKLFAYRKNNYALTYAVATQGGKGTVTITDAATGAFIYTPNANANGADSFSFRVTDATNASSTATMAVTINAVNDPPIITASSALNRKQGTAAINAELATVSDAEGGALSVTASVVPASITLTNLTINPLTGKVTADVAASCAATVGDNFVELTASDGSATTVANPKLKIIVASSQVGISTQPSSQTVSAGGNATISVVASNAVGYQWRRNGVNLSGATANSYSINGATANDAGNYDVVVTGLCGSVTSAAAVLTVTPALPRIVTQPVSRTVAAGTAVSLSVNVTGTVTGYWWWKNGQSFSDAASGAFTSTLTFPNVQPSQAGNYWVAIYYDPDQNLQVTSDSAQLTVLTAPATLLLTEFRFSGPRGAGDWYVELHNATDAPLSTNGLQLGFADAAGQTLEAVPLPANGTIPPRGFYLVAGPDYSLGALAAPDLANVRLNTIANLGGVGIFNGGLNPTQRLDSVASFATSAPQAFLIETEPLPALNGALDNHCWLRNALTGTTWQDTNINPNDWLLLAGTTAVNGKPSQLGAAAPNNASGPSLMSPAALPMTMLDAAKSSTNTPNQKRDTTSVANGALGTLMLRRGFTNNTGKPVSVLRCNVYDITNSATGTLAWINVLNASGGVIATTTGSKTVLGTTLRVPQTEPGGKNAVLEIPLTAPLPPGQTVNVEFRLGVQRGGSYRFFVRLEAIAQ